MKRFSLLAFVLLCPFLLGGTCDSGGSGGGGGGGGGGPSLAPLVTASLAPWAPSGFVGVPFYVEVVVNADFDVLPQSYDLSINVDTTRLKINGVTPNPEFDDDGGFFISEISSLSGVDTLRLVDRKPGRQEQHGAANVTTLELEFLNDGPNTPIVILGRFGATDGREHEYASATQWARSK